MAGQKKGGGGRKIGRNKRRATQSMQAFRCIANKAKRVARAAVAKALKVARGAARTKRRDRWALVRNKVADGHGNHVWKPTFAEFAAHGV